ncbi:unnamed protein product [Coffea canephora]|uniref:DH200=94 genomic scaffold, scaffold_159 n=1 Tax=Coffea canephora TaxID=49390 RepID=A0A068V9T3_COFCA|nr:unnamed protein product [Coffea canephora]
MRLPLLHEESRCENRKKGNRILHPYLPQKGLNSASTPALCLDLDDIQYHVPMFLYVYRLMVCNFLFSNLDQVSSIYKHGGKGRALSSIESCPIRAHSLPPRTFLLDA